MPSLEVISKLIISAFLLSVVVVVEPKVAIISILVLSIGYSLAYWIIRGYLLRRAVERLEFNRRRYQVAQEVLAGVKRS